MTSCPVGYGLAVTPAPRIRRPHSAAGTGRVAEAPQTSGYRQVKFVEVDGHDLSDSDDIVVSDALIQTVGFRGQVEY